MQMIFQDPYTSLNPRMTVTQIIADPLVVNRAYSGKRDLESKVLQLMEAVGLDERYKDVYPHEMDGGRRQRVGVARALALEPEFIVCDEPVSALDVSVQAQILNLLMDLQEERGLTYVFISHDLSVVKHISDEIAVMYLGQCVERAPTQELFQNPYHPYTKALLASIPLPSLRPEDKLRKPIQGEISSAIEPQKGCRFAPRCSRATSHCLGQEIPILQKKNHLVMCLHV